MVIGTRLNGKIEPGAMPWHHRWIGNPFLTWFLNLFYNTGISDAHCGLRAVSREGLDRMNLGSTGMEFASEMIIEASRIGLNITEVPVSYRPREAGDPKLQSFPDGWRHLRFILLQTPAYLFDFPGAIMFSVGLVLMISTFFGINLGFTPRTNSMIAGSLLALVGYQVMFFGAFSKMIQGKTLSRLLTLERGATASIFLVALGLAWSIRLASHFLESKVTPPIEESILGYSLIVLGLQTFFSSFMLSIISLGRPKRK
jgi:hypothetical protein